MSINNIGHPKVIDINGHLRLRMVCKENYKLALPWYENPKVMYYSEGVTEGTYKIDTITKMYDYLSSIGEMYFIEILEDGIWKAIGDVGLSEQNMPIVIGGGKYWGKSIGQKVIEKLLERAKEIKLRRISIEIYKYNERSRNLFTTLGFKKVSQEEKSEYFEYVLGD